jgi:hypothetical protein
VRDANGAIVVYTRVVTPRPPASTSFEGFWKEGPRRGKLGPQTTKFMAPSLMVHSLDAPSLGTTLTVVYAVPMGPSRCRLLARFPFKFNAALPRLVISKVPRWMQHAGQLNVLEDDQVRSAKRQHRFPRLCESGVLDV